MSASKEERELGKRDLRRSARREERVEKERE